MVYMTINGTFGFHGIEQTFKGSKYNWLVVSTYPFEK